MSGFEAQPLDHSGYFEGLVRRLNGMFGHLAPETEDVSVVTRSPMASGRVELFSVRPGIRLFSMSLDIQSEVRLDINPPGPGVFFSLVLDGRSGFAVQKASSHEKNWSFLPGRTVISGFNAQKSRWSLSGNSAHRLVEVQVGGGQARKLIADYRESIQTGAPAVPVGDSGFSEPLDLGLSPELRMVAHQVLTCPLKGRARKLFMEGKALEILALQMDRLCSPTQRQTFAGSGDDLDRLEEARQIIEREYAEPPSLVALARRVGLNDFKLKRGFRALFQTTVYGYVRMVRMEKARILLQKGDLMVSEVASTIGYSCFGHFADAFRKHFGMNPGEFKKRRS